MLTDDKYPKERYREARLTLMHIAIYIAPLSRQEHAAVIEVLKIIDCIVPQDK